jgi:hypothetical protein
MQEQLKMLAKQDEIVFQFLQRVKHEDEEAVLRIFQSKVTGAAEIEKKTTVALMELRRQFQQKRELFIKNSDELLQRLNFDLKIIADHKLDKFHGFAVERIELENAIASAQLHRRLLE